MAIKLTLHEDDERELFRIRRELVGWHHCTGTTQKLMAEKLGRSEKMIHELEIGKVHYRLSTLQQWAGLFDLRVVPELNVIPLSNNRDVPERLLDENDMLLAMAMPFDARRWVRLKIVSDLTVLRHRRGFSAERMAMVLGIKTSAVFGWERTCHDPMVSKLFTYARALDGCVTFDLVERQDYRG